MHFTDEIVVPIFLRCQFSGRFASSNSDERMRTQTGTHDQPLLDDVRQKYFRAYPFTSVATSEDVDHRVPSCAQLLESPDEYLNMGHRELFCSKRILVEKARGRFSGSARGEN
jgi:hypothetical protein